MANTADLKRRGLSQCFMTDLKTGLLSPILERVKKDNTLCLQIRSNYLNIYYRGGNILRISGLVEKPHYRCVFDPNFFTGERLALPPVIQSALDAEAWITNLPHLKQAMDFYFSKHPKLEREAQQQLVRENNIGQGAKSTDYFLCDIEYAESHTKGRFDMVGVKWRSDSASRKDAKNVGLSFFELKFCDGALCGTAGLQSHLKDIQDFLNQEINISRFKEEIKNIFNQMQALGQIEAKKHMEAFNTSKPEYIFLLANHDPASKKLRRELKEISSSFQNFDLKFAVSNFMGYGLYEQNMFSKDEFLKRFKEHI